MSNSQEFASHNGSVNGTRPTERKPSSPAQTTWGRFYEMASVLLLIASFISFVLGFQVGWYWLFLPFLFAGAIYLYRRAAREAVERVKREKQEQAKLKYQVSEIRLLTLKNVGVPTDVTEAVAPLVGQPELPADQFLAKIAQDLSWARVNQWQEKILMYTRIDNAPTVTPAVNSQDQSLIVGIEEGKPPLTAASVEKTS